MEVDEVAENLPLPKEGSTMDEIREHVRSYMPSETPAVIDGVAESLFQRIRVASVGQTKYVCMSCNGEDLHELCTAWFEANGERDLVEVIGGGEEFWCNDCGHEVDVREEPL